MNSITEDLLKVIDKSVAIKSISLQICKMIIHLMGYIKKLAMVWSYVANKHSDEPIPCVVLKSTVTVIWWLDVFVTVSSYADSNFKFMSQTKEREKLLKVVFFSPPCHHHRHESNYVDDFRIILYFIIHIREILSEFFIF